MFDNMGRKLQVFGVLIGILGIIGSVIASIILAISAKSFLTFLLILVGGIVASLLSSYLLYGFGVIVESSEDTHDKVNKLYSMKKAKEQETDNPRIIKMVSSDNKLPKKQESNKSWDCPACGYANSGNATECGYCFRPKK